MLLPCSPIQQRAQVLVESMLNNVFTMNIPRTEHLTMIVPSRQTKNAIRQAIGLRWV